MPQSKIQTSQGIPISNIINKRVVGGNADMVKIIHNAVTVLIFASGWVDSYHVILEDGESMTSSYDIMTKDEINTNFQIDISEYDTNTNN